MGNVPISCCRSRSPRSQRSSSNKSASRAGQEGEYSPSNRNSHRRRSSIKPKPQDNESSQPSHILQHISEREPDDSETDPSSNALNRPIFASRSRSNTKTKITESYNSSSSNSRRQANTPLLSSQDYGYNSATSTNFTQYGTLNDSFDVSVERQRQSSNDHEGFLSDVDRNYADNRLLLSNSPTSSYEIDKQSPYTIKSESKSIGKATSTRFFSNSSVKSSSCSTIYVDDSTISQPDLEQTMKCVSLAIYYHIKNRCSDNSVEIFDEAVHPLRMPNSVQTDQQYSLMILDRENNSHSTSSEPDQKTIYKFVKTLFESAQLSSEYAITTLVYLERLMTYAEMDLTPRTWRRMFLGAILLSSKVWEDQAVWNVDYAHILEEVSVEDINELERQFLELIQFNMNVPSAVYAKYYFHLRTLALKNGIGKEYGLLTVDKARTLEAMSRIHTKDWQSSPIHRKSSPNQKRHSSLERLQLSGRATAILM